MPEESVALKSGNFLAMERKKIHDSSTHVFPPKTKGVNSVCVKKPRQSSIGAFSGTTSYSIDFAKKDGKPAVPRPCSVTRRNRPHPSKVNRCLAEAIKPHTLRIQGLILHPRVAQLCRCTGSFDNSSTYLAVCSFSFPLILFILIFWKFAPKLPVNRL